jgi:hypothetical protein
MVAYGQTREVEKRNMIRDGTKVGVFSKVGYKQIAV